MRRREMVGGLVGVAAAAGVFAAAGCCTPNERPGVAAVIEVPPDRACPAGDAAVEAITDEQGDIEEVTAGPEATAVPAQCCYADALDRGATPACVDAPEGGVDACPPADVAAGIAPARARVTWSWAHVECRYEITDHDWVDVCG